MLRRTRGANFADIMKIAVIFIKITFQNSKKGKKKKKTNKIK